jgi:hypothetical protein
VTVTKTQKLLINAHSRQRNRETGATKMTNKTRQFGETVQGYDIPVLNEREIRAAAGILFVLFLLAFLQAVANDNLVMIKYVNTLFLTDIIIRLFVSPKYSPTLIVGRLIVQRQKPEYVGAIQKKFAWMIGLGLSALMFLLLVVLNILNPFNFLICVTCLVFTFFESAFGICIGCAIYRQVYKEEAQYCPGEVCSLEQKHEIQKTDFLQIAIVFGFFIYAFAIAYFLRNWFRMPPFNPFEYLEKLLTSAAVNL